MNKLHKYILYIVIIIIMNRVITGCCNIKHVSLNTWTKWRQGLTGQSTTRHTMMKTTLLPKWSSATSSTFSILTSSTKETFLNMSLNLVKTKTIVSFDSKLDHLMKYFHINNHHYNYININKNNRILRLKFSIENGI